MNIEEWRTIENYEGLYMVSNLGRVKSLCGFNGKQYVKREKILKPTFEKINKNSNYIRLKVKLTKNKQRKDHKVHRLVAEAFLQNSDKKAVVNHKDGNPLNNNVDNLEWCTQKENLNHAIQTGLRKTFKITEEELKQMYIKDRMSIQEIAMLKNTKEHIISNNIIKYGLTRNRNTKYKINEGELKEMLKTKSNKKIANHFGCDPSLISVYKKRLEREGKIYA